MFGHQSRSCSSSYAGALARVRRWCLLLPVEVRQSATSGHPALGGHFRRRTERYGRTCPHLLMFGVKSYLRRCPFVKSAMTPCQISRCTPSNPESCAVSTCDGRRSLLAGGASEGATAGHSSMRPLRYAGRPSNIAAACINWTCPDRRGEGGGR